jgi:xylan 1,4-beta-xylosidase
MKHFLVLACAIATLSLSAQQPSQVRIDLAHPGKPLEIDHMALGQGGLSPDTIWADRMPEVRALHPRVIRLFIQEYFNVLPEAGQMNWKTLDESVDLILRTGATPLMTIAIKPKVLFPRVDQAITDPDDYTAWENLIAAMVQHYKDRGSRIIYWEVANEPDIGEDGGCPYRFTPEGYVRYYTHTVAAIKRADPDAKVGGPALANPASPLLPALLTAAQGSDLPVDFISWHIYNSDPLAIRATIDRQKRLLEKYPKLHPETFLDEWNMSLSNPVPDPRFQPVFLLETIWQMKDAGLDYSCYYHIRDYHVQPEIFDAFFSRKGAAAMAQWWNLMPQYDGLFDYQNRVRPAYFAFLLLAHLTGQRLPLESSNKAVHGLATYDEYYGNSYALIWNYSDKPISLILHLDGIKTASKANSLVLDATAPSDDQNIRLRPAQRLRIKSGVADIPMNLAPWQVTFWSFEARGI